MPDDPWELVSAVPALSHGDVHVWRDSVSAPAPWASGELLSAEEQAQASRMSAPVRRATFIRARSCLRFLAGGYLGVPPAAVPIRILEKGKPVIDVPGGAEPLAISVTHSGSLIAVAFTRAGDVGVDIEYVDPGVDRAAISRRFFSTGEAAALERLQASEQLQLFFALWAHKEAMLKAAGDGLSVPLAEAEFTISPRSAPVLIRVPPTFGTVTDWAVRGMNAGPDMAGAVAVRGRVSGVQFREWTDAA